MALIELPDNNRLSLTTIFGQVRYLESLTERLAKHDIFVGGQLEELTEQDFWRIVGRTTPDNKERVRDRMDELGMKFRV
jgi:hypothetical protein